MPKDIQRRTRLIVYDFDGVLTNNKVILSADGMESVILDRSDGMAIRMIKDMGIEQVIMTSETTDIAVKRAEKLGIPAINKVVDKKIALLDYCKERSISPDLVLYIGNDINDLEAMKRAGYAACPSDAHDKIKKISDFVLKSRGGNGVVRELMDMIKG